MIAQLSYFNGNAQTFFLNDSTICTSVEKVRGTAQKILILEAQIRYLESEIIKDPTYQVENDINEKQKKVLALKLQKIGYYSFGFLLGFFTNEIFIKN